MGDGRLHDPRGARIIAGGPARRKGPKDPKTAAQASPPGMVGGAKGGIRTLKGFPNGS